MSLDVYLTRKRYLSYDEGKTYTEDDEQVYSANITHNLGRMAEEAGIYEALWRPYRLKEGCDFTNDEYDKEMEFEKKQVIRASDLIAKLNLGLALLKSDPTHFEKFNSINGWGMYDNFVPFVENYLKACEENPDAIVSVWR